MREEAGATLTGVVQIYEISPYKQRFVSLPFKPKNISIVCKITVVLNF
jgi:hypothetical protein